MVESWMILSMVKWVILSDVYGNLEVFEWVLEDIVDCGIEEVFCFGDIIGYGFDLCVCIDWCFEFDFCIFGNYD